MRGVAALVVACLALAACASDDDPGPPSTSTSPATSETSAGPDGGVLVEPGPGPTPESVDAADDWPLPGRDYRNSRALVEPELDRGNVDLIEVAWSAPLEGMGGLGNAATTPVIVGDTVFVQDLSSNVRAFDLATGDLRWEQRYDLTSIGPNGVAVGWGRAFAAKGAREIVALDAATGDELWATEIAATPTTGIDIQPQLFGGLVLVSTVPVSLTQQYAGGDRGVLHALDAVTGEVVWTFDTVLGDDLWGNPEINSGGGAWYPPALDPDAGTVFWGIANPAPFPGTAEFPNGSSRPGPNLYTESVVALDALTGELRWYQQAIEHDLFDRDLVLTALVAVDRDPDDDGPADVLVGTGKLGRLIGHDPVTGEVLWDTPVGIHENDDLTSLVGETPILPGTFGGVITPPAAADGVVYAAVLNAPTTLSPDVPSYIGSEIGTMPGEMVAVDAATGALLWATEINGDPLGGALVVGELVFTGTYQGMLYALDRVSGDIVWEMEAPGGLNGWPAAVDDLIVWPIGLSQPATLLALRLP